MFSNRRLLPMAICLALCLPLPAPAQTMYFPQTTTINSAVSGLVYVGKDSTDRNTSPTVNIVEGADLWQSTFVFNSSHLVMSGGLVRESVIAVDTSSVTISGGEIGGSLGTGSEGPNPRRGGSISMSGGRATNGAIDLGGTLSLRGGRVLDNVILSRGSSLYMYESGWVSGGIGIGLDSQAYVFGGLVSRDISANFNGRVNISGGSVDGVLAGGNSTISMSGGRADDVNAVGAATITLGGGSADRLSSRNTAVVHMTGGSVANLFFTQDKSIGNLHDGNVFGHMTAFDDSTINIYGGTVHGTVLAHGGTVNIYGGVQRRGVSFITPSVASGDLPAALLALDEGLIQLFGSGLAHTLLDPDFFYEDAAVRGGWFHKYALSGRLVDGTDMSDLSLLVQNGTGARFSLISQVPEAEPLVLLLAGLVVVWRAAYGGGRARAACQPA